MCVVYELSFHVRACVQSKFKWVCNISTGVFNNPNSFINFFGVWGPQLTIIFIVNTSADYCFGSAIHAWVCKVSESSDNTHHALLQLKLTDSNSLFCAANSPKPQKKKKKPPRTVIWQPDNTGYLALLLEKWLKQFFFTMKGLFGFRGMWCFFSNVMQRNSRK